MLKICQNSILKITNMFPVFFKVLLMQNIDYLLESSFLLLKWNPACHGLAFSTTIIILTRLFCSQNPAGKNGFIVIEPSPLQLCPIFDLHGLCLVTLQYFANIFRSITNCERLGNWDLLNAMTFINTFFVEATKCITRLTTSWNIWMDQSSPDTMSKPTIFQIT